MGYSVATIFLVDGRKFDRVVIDSGYVVRIGNGTAVPFREPQIDRIVVTNDKGPSLRSG